MATKLTRLRPFGLALLLTAIVLPYPVTARAQEASPLSPPPAPPSAPSVEELARRVQELEAIIRQMQAERSQNGSALATQSTAALPGESPSQGAAGSNGIMNPSPGPGGPGIQAGSAPPGAGAGGAAGTGQKGGVLAGWEDSRGFFLRSADEKFNLHLTGQLQSDYRAFLDGRDYTDPDSFLVRRARLGIEANLLQYYEFRLLPDFSNAQSPSATTASERIQDAYMNIHYWDCFQVETGKFKQPVSYEQLIQDRYVPTAERSLIDQLVPARDEGLMVHGEKLFSDRLDYAFSVSNGEINGDYDSDKIKDINARMVVRPLNSPNLWPILRGLQVGVSGSTGKEEEPMNPLILRTPLTVPWFTFNSTVRADGIRERLSPEVVYFYNSFGFAAQYYREEQRMQPLFTGSGSQFDINVPFEGYYVLATYLITGEHRTTYSEPIVPLHNFDPCHPCVGSGAWELVARVSRLQLGEEVFEHFATGRTSFVSLANPAGNSNSATETTLGFNWYLNPYVRMQFNWEHDWFSDPVRLGPGPAGLLEHQDALVTRLQFIF